MQLKKFLQSRQYLYYSLLFAIILVGIILRFYNVPDRYHFDGDAIRDAIVAYEGARDLYLPLTGPFSSTGPYTFGPWYYYSIIIASFIAPTPYTPWIVMGISSLITIFLMYGIGELLGSKKFGLILAAITAVAPMQIAASQGLSNINPVPFFTVIAIWISLKILKAHNTHVLWYIFLGIALGLGINAHYQAIGLLPLPFFLWIYKGFKNYKIPVFIATGLFITFTPLLFFNLQTDWDTLKGIQQMYTSRDQIYVPNSWKLYVFQFWPSFLSSVLSTPVIISILMFSGFLAMLGYNFVKRNVSVGMVILFIVFSLNVLFLRYYWGERNFVYLFYLEPIILIFIGYMLFSMLKLKYGKFLVGCISLVLLGYMLIADYNHAQGEPQQVIKRDMQILSNKYPNKAISIYTCNRINDNHATSLAYLLRFKNNLLPQKEKIGVISNEKCSLPNTKQYDFTSATISAKFSSLTYPRLNQSTLADFSVASAGAIQNASWVVISTENVFENTVKWWGKKP